MASRHTSYKTHSFVHSLLASMSFNGILQLILVVSAFAERCTRAVPVQKYPAKKMHVLRRVPASCSNWDKAWSWITNVDCGTKYRLDYITAPPREVRQYKLEYVCCDGDTDCEEAENIHSSTFDSTDEKFLAIVLGSTAAAVIVIIIVVAISLCHKRRRCVTSGRERGHAYDRAEAEDYQKGDATVEKLCRAEDCMNEGECTKPSEPVYAEIGEETLPRYTDLFCEENISPQDPFVHATAPAYYSGGAKEHGDLRRMPSQESKDLPHYTNTSDVTPLQSSAPTIQEETNYAKVNKKTRLVADCVVKKDKDPSDVTEMKYYNVREKKKKKKRAGQTGGKDKEGRRRSKTGGNGSSSGGGGGSSSNGGVELMVKSSSASDTVGSIRSSTETSLVQQKRSSAPPDSIEVRNHLQQCSDNNSSNSQHQHPQQHGSSTSRGSNSCDVISICTIHEKPCPSPISPHQGGGASPINLSPSAERHSQLQIHHHQQKQQKQQQQVLRKSPSDGHRESIGSSNSRPRSIEICQSYENIPRSNSQPNSIHPGSSFDRVHQIPHSQSQSQTLRAKNRDPNKPRETKTKSSQKRCSKTSLPATNEVVNDTVIRNAKQQHQLHNKSREGTIKTSPKISPSVSPSSSSVTIDMNTGHHHEGTKPCKQQTSKQKSCQQNAGRSPTSTKLPMMTSSACKNNIVPNNPSSNDYRGVLNSPRGGNTPTYDTLQYSRDPSPDHLYQKLQSSSTDEGTAWKV